MKRFALAALLAVLMTGCVTPGINWSARIGIYTYNQAVVDYGPPDKSARLSDGTLVAEWMIHGREVFYTPGPYFGPPGYCFEPFPPPYSVTTFPASYLRLVFGADGKLEAAKSFAK